MLHTYYTKTSENGSNNKRDPFLSKQTLQADLLFEVRTILSLSDEEKEMMVLPHRHDYYEAFFITCGTGIVNIDLDEYAILDDIICIVQPGKIHQVTLSEQCEGYVLSFSRDFYHLSLEKSLLQSSSCNTFLNGRPRQVIPGIKNELIELIKRMEREFNCPGLYRTEALRGLLKVFMIYLSRLSAETPEHHTGIKSDIVERFMSMLNEKYIACHMPADYSDELCISTNYLNEIVKKETGYSTRHHIQQRILLEAKRLAIYSGDTMKQVAYHLGFDDPFHFSRFFKNGCGDCFTDFKRKAIEGKEKACLLRA